MKKTAFTLSLLVLLASCGGGAAKESDTKDSPELNAQEEAELTSKITDAIADERKDLEKVTEENLQDVDSLLENFSNIFPKLADSSADFCFLLIFSDGIKSPVNDSARS